MCFLEVLLNYIRKSIYHTFTCLFLCYYKRYHTLHLPLVDVDTKMCIELLVLSWCDNIAIRDFLHFKLSPSLWILLVVDERRGARQLIYS